jgi:hypothetical protein
MSWWWTDKDAEEVAHITRAAFLKDNWPLEPLHRLISQRILVLECIRTMAVKFPDESALYMTQAMLVSDARSPEFTRPLWIQPLAPLPFQRHYLIRGICVYNPYDPDRAIKLMLAKDKRPGGAVGILRELSTAPQKEDSEFTWKQE